MTTGLAVFDTSVQDTNLWLKEIEERLGHCSRQEAYAAARAVLHALRDRLPAPGRSQFRRATADAVARSLFLRAGPAHKPSRSHSANEFADAVSAFLPPKYRFDPLLASRAVFAAITRFTSEGEPAKVMSQLPEPLRDLWRAAIAV